MMTYELKKLKKNKTFYIYYGYHGYYHGYLLATGFLYLVCSCQICYVAMTPICSVWMKTLYEGAVHLLVYYGVVQGVGTA